MNHLGCVVYHSINHFAGGGLLVDAVIAPVVLGALLLAWAFWVDRPTHGRPGMMFYTLLVGGPTVILFAGAVRFLVGLQTSCHVKIL